MLRRIFFIYFIFTLTAVSVFGAGRVEQPEPTLTVWDFKFNDSRTHRVYSRIDRLFTDSNPEIKLEHIGFDDEEYIPALRTALLAGTGPDIIWLHQGTEFTEYQSYLEPLDDFLEKTSIHFRDESLAVCFNPDGRLKSLPVSIQGMGWYYNKELFKQAGLDPENPPINWHDFLEACESLKSHGITPIASGNNRPLSTDFIRRSLISAFYTDSEIKSFFQQGRGITSEEFRLIMEFCLTLRKEGYLNPDGIFRPYFNYAPDSFSSGQCAMIVGLLSDIAHWQDFSDKIGKDNLGYFPNLIHPAMPRPGNQLLQSAGLIIGVNKNSPNKETAYRYLENLFSEKSQRLLIEGLGMLAAVEDLSLPVNEYPVLLSIDSALQNTGADIELHTPSTFIRDTIYRYDKLYLNSMEISTDDYIQRLYDKFKLF